MLLLQAPRSSDPAARASTRRALPSIVLVLVVVAQAFLAACGAGEPSTPSPATDTALSEVDGGSSPGATTSFSCDVERVLDAHCRTCHGASPSFGAPMPLVTPADFGRPLPSDPKKTVFDGVLQRVNSDTRPMPPLPNERLEPKERELLAASLATTRPGPATCGTEATLPNVSGTMACEPDAFLRPAHAWTMAADAHDQYVCFGMDVTHADKRHVVGIAPHVDNATILHHVILLQSDVAFPEEPFACPASTGAMGRMIYGWAPGGKAMELPLEAGIPESGTTHYLVQIHYNNARGLVGEKDATGIDLCTTRTLRKYDADMLAFGTTTIDVAPRSDLTLDCRYTLPPDLSGIHLFAAMPHMHQKGTRMETVRQSRGSGAEVDLGAVPSWDFANQVWLPLDATLHEGDVVRTTCAWSNPSDQPVRFGENTADEMCWSFTMYYPKVTRDTWNWANPSFGARCTPRNAVVPSPRARAGRVQTTRDAP